MIDKFPKETSWFLICYVFIKKYLQCLPVVTGNGPCEPCLPAEHHPTFFPHIPYMKSASKLLKILRKKMINKDKSRLWQNTIKVILKSRHWLLWVCEVVMSKIKVALVKAFFFFANTTFQLSPLLEKKENTLLFPSYNDIKYL